MDEEQDPVATPDCGVVATHERWAYSQGWAAGLTEGRRQGFDEGYGVGFDAGADIGAARLLTALKTVVHEWSPELLQRRGCASPTSRPRRPEGMR
jgi:hypothetical protein